MFDQLHHVLWDGLDEEINFPAKRPLLAHYTTVESFEKIVRTGEFWFSNPLYMNDLEELDFGMNEGARELRRHPGLAEACGSDERHRYLIDVFDALFDAFDRQHVLGTYVLCFSEHAEDDYDGLLSMWRAYGARGRGLAIVFDSSKLGYVESSPLILGRVKYETKEARLQWMRTKIDHIAQVLKQGVPTDQDLADTATCWIGRLTTYALFTKHCGFKEEQEWRVVYLSQRDSSGSLSSMYGHAITHRGLEPKLKLKLGALPTVMSTEVSIEALAERIVLGPSISSHLAGASICRMLERLGKQSLADMVVASSIPYRPEVRYVE